MSGITLHAQYPAANQLGECVLWDWRHQRLWWTDILGQTLYYLERSNVMRHIPLEHKLTSFGLRKEPTQLICAFAEGFALLNWDSGKVKWLEHVESTLPNNRMNDGRVDRQGRFLAGSMRMLGNDTKGSLYRLDADNAVSLITDIEISNALCWDSSGTRMYFADSNAQIIWQIEYEPNDARIGRKTVFARTEGHEHPDGACVDSEDHLWVAIWGGSKVIRYRPDGSIDQILETPCIQPTCVCFGGASLNQLYVTSAWDGLGITQREAHNGDVFVFDTPYTGLKESICTTTWAHKQE